MIDWLKTTIPGIILLGAVGSILAVGIIKVCTLLFSRVLKPTMNSALGFAFAAMRGPHYVVEYLRTSTDVRELIVTCTLLHSYVVFFAAFSVIGIATSIAGVLMKTDEVLTGMSRYWVLGGSFLFFISVIGVKFILNVIWELYFIYMKQADEQALVRARDDFPENKA